MNAADISSRQDRRHAAAGAMDAALTLREAGPADLQPLVFFFDTVLRRDYFMRRGQIAEILADRCHRVLIAEVGGILIGVAILSSGATLINLLIHPAYRGIGIGRALLRASGATRVRAKLDMRSGDPRPFYAAAGFVPAAGGSGKPNIEILQIGDAGGSQVNEVAPAVDGGGGARPASAHPAGSETSTDAGETTNDHARNDCRHANVASAAGAGRRTDRRASARRPGAAAGAADPRGGAARRAI